MWQRFLMENPQGFYMPSYYSCNSVAVGREKQMDWSTGLIVASGRNCNTYQTALCCFLCCLLLPSLITNCIKFPSCCTWVNVFHSESTSKAKQIHQGQRGKPARFVPPWSWWASRSPGYRPWQWQWIHWCCMLSTRTVQFFAYVKTYPPDWKPTTRDTHFAAKGLIEMLRFTMFCLLYRSETYVFTMWIAFIGFYNGAGSLKWSSFFCPFRCGFMHQDRDILKIGHLADACMTNFPSLLPCSDVCPQAGIYLSFVHAFFGHQPIRNALLQEAPRPNCRFPWSTPTHQLRGMDHCGHFKKGSFVGF